MQQAAQVGQRDDRQAETDQRIVGIVPLGTLGVHPDSTVGNEIGELRLPLFQRYGTGVTCPARHSLPCTLLDVFRRILV